jgi:hypothetical protein
MDKGLRTKVEGRGTDIDPYASASSAVPEAVRSSENAA